MITTSLTKRLLLLLIGTFVTSGSFAASQWWGYYNDQTDLTQTGFGLATTYNAAIHVAGTDPVAGGKQLEAVRFYLVSKTNVRDISVWVSAQLPGSASAADVVTVPLPLSDLKAGFNDVALPQAVTIGGEGLYVGYSFTITDVVYNSDQSPLVITKNRPSVEGGFFLKLGSSAWSNFSASDNGNVGLKLQLNGDFADYGAVVYDLPDQTIIKGESHQATVAISNAGTKALSDVDYIVASDGVDGPEVHYELSRSIRTFANFSTLTIPIEAGDHSGVSAKTIRITKVNGEPNEVNSVAHTNFLVLGRLVPRTTVEEEYTGTWCGWCPRGMKGIELSEQKFGDRYIGIAVHYNDVMECSDYVAHVQTVASSGLPYCEIDRSQAPDTYYNARQTGYGLDAAINAAQEVYSVATVALKGEWADEAQTRLKATTDVTFQLDINGRLPYALAYVLVGDSLYGTTGDWAQHNYYSKEGSNTAKYAQDPYLVDYYNQPALITDIKYSHVALAAWNLTPTTGNTGNDAVEGVPLTLDFEANLSGNKFVNGSVDCHLKKENLHLVALLIDTATGRIVNADRQPIAAPDAQGISELPLQPSSPGRQQCYDLQGRPLDAHPRKGLYINNGKLYQARP